MIFSAIIAGCGNGTKLPGTTGRVDGKAEYNKAPIPPGCVIVMMHQDTGIVATGLTSKSGQFSMTMRGRPELLIGEYVVNIRPVGEMDENATKLTADTVPETWKAIPQKYWFSTESPERYIVQTGKNVYQLNLQD